MRLFPLRNQHPDELLTSAGTVVDLPREDYKVRWKIGFRVKADIAFPMYASGTRKSKFEANFP